MASSHPTVEGTIFANRIDTHPRFAPEYAMTVMTTLWQSNVAMENHLSLDWFKGKSTENHGFYHQIGWVFL